jgi:hypothetical protein
VTLSDPQASVAASGTTLACPIHAQYTFNATVPMTGGCRLVGGTSKLNVKFPTGTDADSVRITTAKVNNTTVTAEATADVTLARLPVPMDIGNGQTFPIELTVVQNPTTAATTHTLQLSASSPFFSSAGATATTNSSTYTISPQTTCPTLDFYVRDWTDVPNVKHDDGNTPDSSTNTTGNTIPPNCWAKCSDVWNQSGSAPPSIAFDNYFTGNDPALMGSNNAFARVTRKTAAPTIPIYRPVTATFFSSLYGVQGNFQPLGSVTTTVSSNDTATILSPLTNWTVPDLPSPPNPPGTRPVAGVLHNCVAVQIDSAADHMKTAGLTTSDIPGPADGNIRGDDNKALRNYDNILTTAPPPPPPPPAPPGGGAGPMAHFGAAHNAGLKTRDMVIRYEASPDVLKHMIDAKVQEDGGETPEVRPGSTFTLARMRPGETRWIGFNYTLVSGTEGEPLPVSFSEVDGDKVLGAFHLGIQPAPVAVMVQKNLHAHRAVFAQIATVFGIPQAKEESAAVDALLRDQAVPEERYVWHMKRHQGPIDASVSRLLALEKRGDPFGLAGTLRSFDESLGSGSTAHVTTAHLALLEKLDAFQTMLNLAKGDPADVVQMVLWQKELYTTVPQLKDLAAAASVVKESDRFIAGYAKAKPGSYSQHIGVLQKSFRATADALKKSGVDVSAEVAQLARPTKSVAALQKAHRDYLLKLDDLAGSAPTQQQQTQQQQKH